MLRWLKSIVVAGFFYDGFLIVSGFALIVTMHLVKLEQATANLYEGGLTPKVGMRFV
jgi:hypothetical protein